MRHKQVGLISRNVTCVRTNQSCLANAEKPKSSGFKILHNHDPSLMGKSILRVIYSQSFLQGPRKRLRRRRENKLQCVLREQEGVGIEENISGQRQRLNFIEHATF